VADTKKVRADGQLSGLAGEFFVAAELLKRGIQTSVTFGNAVQVKTLRRRNFVPIAHDRVEAKHTYVFVILNGPEQAVRYFIVPGKELAENPERFGSSFKAQTFPGIKPGVLDEFENRWDLFGPAG
jgi:hypothetical protein